MPTTESAVSALREDASSEFVKLSRSIDENIKTFNEAVADMKIRHGGLENHPNDVDAHITQTQRMKRLEKTVVDFVPTLYLHVTTGPSHTL